MLSLDLFFFFFNDTATTEIYTLSLHDALPILLATRTLGSLVFWGPPGTGKTTVARLLDRKSTRLNSSHGYISYAVFCLKKKNNRCQAGRYGSAATTRSSGLAPDRCGLAGLSTH